LIRILSIVGARPQYIKLAPLHHELARRRVEHLVVNTGQHYDYNLSQIFFDQLKLPRPIANLGVGSGANSEMTARIIERTAKVLRRRRPDLTIVYGDTNSTLGGALAATQLNIPLAHVEAGLRCFDLSVPEELNRVVTDRISQFLFCPTATAKANLRGEGISKGVYQTGDVLYDVMKLAMPSRSETLGVLERIGLTPQQYLLLTLHRAGTVDDEKSLRRFVGLVGKIREPMLFPMHPRTRRRLRQFGLLNRLRQLPRLRIIEPCGYRETLAFLSQTRLALTDSGGLQREAYRLRVPVLLLRETTEWVEIVKSGGGIIVGTDPVRLQRGLRRRRFRFSDRSFCRLGAARRIVKHLLD
jgi:UDP-N-acetylglucosamine 2-epimerase